MENKINCRYCGIKLNSWLDADRHICENHKIRIEEISKAKVNSHYNKTKKKIKNCKECGIEFKPRWEKQIFHNSNCRYSYNRKLKKETKEQ